MFLYSTESPTETRPQWKFWRSLSLRRRNKHKYDWTKEAQQDTDLDDVKRTNSLKPPPKPPRLFLFRSSSISTPRNSVVLGGKADSPRNSYIMSQAYQNSRSKDGLPTAHVAPVRKEISAPIPIVTKPMPEVCLKTDGLADPKTSVAEKIESDISNLTLNSSGHHKIKIITPDLTPRRSTLRRKKSTNIMTEQDRYRDIIQNSTELICQKVDPEGLLDDLQTQQVITSIDLQAFRGHPDKRLVCESILQILLEGKVKQFLSFCDILRNCDIYREIATVLDAMKGVYDAISNIPESQEAEEQTLGIEEEKQVTFDLGYYNCETGVLKPVTQLEKSRGGDGKRISRDSAFFKRCSRLSFHSISSADGYKPEECDASTFGHPVLTVCISGYSLHGERFKALGKVLETFECILELHVGKTSLSGSDMGYLIVPLQKCKSLTVLDLRLNTIGNEGAKLLASALSKTSSIRQLNISSTGIDSEGCKALGEGMKTNKSVIELDMSFLDIADSGCICLGNMLKQNKILTKLRLRSGSISWIGCGILFEGVQQSKSLIELDLSRNFIGDDGMEMMCRHLNDKSGLQELNLENCGITSKGCAMLSDVIMTNKTLQHLDLSANFISDAGVFKIANALERNKSIRTLGLNMCGITNDGFAKLLDILECNPTMTLMKLCYNRLGREHTNPSATSDGLRYRVRIVTSSNPKLKLLLWGNAFDES